MNFYFLVPPEEGEEYPLRIFRNNQDRFYIPPDFLFGRVPPQKRGGI